MRDRIEPLGEMVIGAEQDKKKLTWFVLKSGRSISYSSEKTD